MVALAPALTPEPPAVIEPEKTPAMPAEVRTKAPWPPVRLTADVVLPDVGVSEICRLVNAISVTAVVPSLSVPSRKLKLPLADTPPIVTQAPVRETSTTGPAGSVWSTATDSVLKATENAPGVMERSPGRWVKIGSALVALPLNCPATP